jgi:hypothetical protein
MFVVKALSVPQSEAPESYYTRVGSGLAHKHCTKLEGFVRDKRSFLFMTSLKKLSRDKHASLFCRSVSDEEKKCFSTPSGSTANGVVGVNLSPAACTDVYEGVCKLDSGKPVFNAFFNFSVDMVSETGIVGANLLKLSSLSARMAQNKPDR